MMAEVAKRGPGHRGAASGGVCVAPKYVGFENRELEVAVFARKKELEGRATESSHGE